MPPLFQILSPHQKDSKERKTDIFIETGHFRSMMPIAAASCQDDRTAASAAAVVASHPLEAQEVQIIIEFKFIFGFIFQELNSTCIISAIFFSSRIFQEIRSLNRNPSSGLC